MDAKDRLRLYLEQRREMGESELVLDTLPVEDVLRMLGAPKTAHGKSVASATKTAGATPVATAQVAAPRIETSTAEASSPQELPAPRSYGDVKSVRDGSEELPRETTAQPLQPVAPTQNRSSGAFNWRNELSGPSAHAPPPVVQQTTHGESWPSWITALGIPTGFTAEPIADPNQAHAVATLSSLDDVAAMIAGCRACPLGATAINPVPGEGNADAEFVCVGEAPGQTEDETGRPFVGAAGQLLTKILAAIQLSRDDVFICNVLKHRPPGNRNPLPQEVHACTPYLTRQLELIKPRVILALGAFAAQTLLNTPTAVGKLRGQVHRYQGIPLIVTYHPSALLRTEALKRPAWEDVKLARRVLDAARAASPA